MNCGAIPEGTINSELFGHEKGAFTGATAERKGYFETVDGGTIFLDEVGEMPLDTQSYLLRVLESGEFIRVGSSVVHKTNVRVIAASNTPLEEKIRKGKFRDDLYYRLSTVPISVPALHERKGDVPILLRKFAMDFAERYRTDPIRFNEQALELLNAYRWNGNIRELKNLVEQLSVLSEEKNITADLLSYHIPHIKQRNLPALKDSSSQEAINERDLLYKVLFDMRQDMSDLKNLVWELIRKNKLELPDHTSTRSLESGLFPSEPRSLGAREERGVTTMPDVDTTLPEKPIILPDTPEAFDDMEVVEESLSLEEMEKQLISKALKKHRGKRKHAAHELGISERTLYRKIKQYED